MESWIRRNESKLMLCAGLFICWCFYSIVHEGGSVIPRIESLEKRVSISDNRFIEIDMKSKEINNNIDEINSMIDFVNRDLTNRLLRHKHRFFTGEVVEE